MAQQFQALFTQQMALQAQMMSQGSGGESPFQNPMMQMMGMQAPAGGSDQQQQFGMMPPGFMPMMFPPGAMGQPAAGGMNGMFPFGAAPNANGQSKTEGQ